VEPLDLDGDVISLSTATIPIDAPTGQDQYQRRLAARTKDKIYLLTYKGKTERAISIPESFQDKDLTLYVSLKSTTILAVNHLVPHSEEFAWVDDTGKVAKNIEVPLLSEPPPDPKVVAWQTAALVPATLCYAVVLLLFLPVISVFKDFFPNYSAALKSWWAAGWRPFARKANGECARHDASALCPFKPPH